MFYANAIIRPYCIILRLLLHYLGRSSYLNVVTFALVCRPVQSSYVYFTDYPARTSISDTVSNGTREKLQFEIYQTNDSRIIRRLCMTVYSTI